MLSPEAAAEPGKWRTDTMEPMRAIMDAPREEGVREVVVMKGTQVGYTEALLNTVGYHIDMEPCPILWLLPDQKAVDEISKNRLQPMLRDTPRLSGKVKPPRSRDSSNTIASKQFPGGRLAIVGSHAPNDISSRPIRLVICDETDRYALSAGVDGDPMSLAAKRQTWFWNRLTIKGSSPNVKGRSVIEREYRLSDMRECHVACPHCEEKQVLRWANVKWDKVKNDAGKTIEHKPETASYQCEACGVLWDDADRFYALGKVKPDDWRPTAPFRGIAGFHVPQFLSTRVKLSEIVTEFLTAYGKLPGTAPDITKQQVFVNTVLAESWEEQGETVDEDALAKRAEPYGPADLPAGVRLTTAGIDVQSDRLEMQVIGWGAGEECWVIEYKLFTGNPAQPSVWRELDQYLMRTRYATVDGRTLRIRAACVDTGGHHTAEVYAYCKGKGHRRIYPIKGDDGPRPVWPPRSSRAKDNNRVYIVGVDTAKDQIYARLNIPPRKEPAMIDQPHPGRIHFPSPDPEVGTDLVNEDYFNQLTAETVMTRYRKGKPYREWIKPPGRQNEALDTFAYALAARMSMGVRLPHHETEVETDAPAAPTKPTRKVVVKRRAATTKKPPKRRRSAAEIGRMMR